MSKIKQLVNEAYSALIQDLKSGDTILQGGSYDRPYETSKKTGEHRIKFIETIRSLLVNKEITTQEANEATGLFGRKTTKLFWNKTS